MTGKLFLNVLLGCFFVYFYVFTSTLAYIHTRTYTHTCINIHTHTHIYIHPSTPANTHPRTHARTHVHIHTQTYMLVFILYLLLPLFPVSSASCSTSLSIQLGFFLFLSFVQGISMLNIIFITKYLPHVTIPSRCVCFDPSAFETILPSLPRRSFALILVGCSCKFSISLDMIQPS